MTENPYRPSQNAEPARAWDEGYRAAIADLALVAGENPYDPWSSVEAHDGWRDGAACGVAAERARADEILSLIYVMLTGAEPMWAEMPLDERCARAANEAQQAVLAALSPEQTTPTEGSEGT